MALYRLICAFGHHSLVIVLTRCGLSLPVYFLADEKHSRCLTAKVYLPTIASGVCSGISTTQANDAAALTQSPGAFQCTASQQEPAYRHRVWPGVASMTYQCRMPCSKCLLEFGFRAAPELKVEVYEQSMHWDGAPAILPALDY